MKMESDTGFGGSLRTHAITHDQKLMNGVFTDVDDILILSGNKQAVAKTGSKLDHAREVGHKTTDELRTLVEGLDQRISEIGITVAEAQNFQGKERFINALGKLGLGFAKKKALQMRHDRLQTIDLTDAVKEIQNFVSSTIIQLGQSEADYKEDVTQYKHKLDEVLDKQIQATPQYLTVQAQRQKVENDLTTLKDELTAGTLSQAERPEKERQLEDVQRHYDDLILQEKTLAAVVKEATEAIPALQEDRDAANQSMQSLHAMRQGMMEKFNNLRVILERAATAVKAQAKAELYKSVDPAFNKAIDVITDNNIATAGALLETWADRIKHSAIDPERSKELLNQLLGHISDAAKDLQDMEDKMKSNPVVRAEEVK
jgi:chromosome segregation ATPase